MRPAVWPGQARTCSHVALWPMSVACNQANPMVGSRVQQTCKVCVEQAVEVVRNGKDGTGLSVWQPAAEGSQ